MTRPYSPSNPPVEISTRYVFVELKKIAQSLKGIFQPEDWRNIGDTNEPAFTNSWANFGGTDEVAAFYKDPLGRVWIKGLIAGGTVDNSAPYSPAFTLPEGYRPLEDTLFDQVDGTKSPSAVIDIRINGDVNITKGNNTFISLAGISFRI